ncbi:uncharacterized protein [Manis javanica]|uniref:uncharacterized protein isoform X3 n=1 Tax=Manis javanica TaxID=9974 RepID=UPI003C6D9F3F
MPWRFSGSVLPWVSFLVHKMEGQTTWSLSFFEAGFCPPGWFWLGHTTLLATRTARAWSRSTDFSCPPGLPGPGSPALRVTFCFVLYQKGGPQHAQAGRPPKSTAEPTDGSQMSGGRSREGTPTSSAGPEEPVGRPPGLFTHTFSEAAEPRKKAAASQAPAQPRDLRRPGDREPELLLQSKALSGPAELELAAPGEKSRDRDVKSLPSDAE